MNAIAVTTTELEKDLLLESNESLIFDLGKINKECLELTYRLRQLKEQKSSIESYLLKNLNSLSMID